MAPIKVLTPAQHRKRIANSLRTGEPIRMDPSVDHFGDPLPEERLCRILARCLEAARDPDYAAISWASQVEAADYYNSHGLIATMDRILELDPKGLDSN